MRRILLVVLSVVAVVAAAVSPAAAITYGEPDAGEHPYVGFMIYYVPAESAWYSCSGTLVDANTFLTAGHCTYDIGVKGKDTPGTSGGTDVWVTFNDTDVLAGWPARADYADEQSLYLARSKWLDANKSFVKGTAIPHPAYDEFAAFPVTYDVGVVELSTNVRMKTYGVIAPLGTVDELVASKGPNDALVESVGYGIQSVQPNPQDDSTRYKSTSRIVEITGNMSAGGNLHTLNNPSQVGGVGGTCSGDSGGPVFVNNTNVILAVVSYGFSGTCHGADYSWRVDTTASQDFLRKYVSIAN
jgi:hypothetical protein